MQTIYYSGAACGAGKTKWAVKHMGRTPGRYIYAVDRTEEFSVRQSLIINNGIQSGASGGKVLMRSCMPLRAICARKPKCSTKMQSRRLAGQISDRPT